MINILKISLFFFICSSAIAYDYSILDGIEISERDSEWVKKYAPLAIEWFQDIEAEYYSVARELREDEFEIAKSMRVSNPNRFRILVLERPPLPKNPEFLIEYRRLGMDMPAKGMVLGNIVYLNPEHEKNLNTLSHEFVHSNQLEELGLEQYLIKYMALLKTWGYWNHPMEVEARERAIIEIRQTGS